jgi:hypothetical protein
MGFSVNEKSQENLLKESKEGVKIDGQGVILKMKVLDISIETRPSIRVFSSKRRRK